MPTVGSVVAEVLGCPPLNGRREGEEGALGGFLT